MSKVFRHGSQFVGLIMGGSENSQLALSIAVEICSGAAGFIVSFDDFCSNFFTFSLLQSVRERELAGSGYFIQTNYRVCS